MDNENTMTFSIDKERYQYHYKKRRRKIIRLLIVLIIWAILIIYLFTPFSTYKMMNVKGNVYLSEQEIIDMAGIKNTWWWIVDSEKLTHKLQEHENITNVSVSKGFDGLNISILERYPIATRNDLYLMNNMSLIEKEKYKTSINELIDVSLLQEQHLNLFANQYIHVDLDIRKIFYSSYMEDEKIIVLKGKFDESSYFEMKLNLECMAIKLSKNNFLNIKSEMLGKISELNVQYNQDNPCIIRYNLSEVYEYEIG